MTIEEYNTTAVRQAKAKAIIEAMDLWKERLSKIHTTAWCMTQSKRVAAVTSNIADRIAIAEWLTVDQHDAMVEGVRQQLEAICHANLTMLRERLDAL